MTKSIANLIDEYFSTTLSTGLVGTLKEQNVMWLVLGWLNAKKK